MISIQAPVCVAPTADICGEGAVWQAAGQALYWTDINRFLIHRLTPADGCVKTWFFDEPVTSLILTSAERTLAVVLGSRVVLWDPASGAMRDLGFYLEGWPRIRCNDARADPQGTLWLGSMANNVNPDGSSGSIDGQLGKLFSVASDGSSKEWKSGIGVANTFAWNPAATQFYFADTLANTVWQYQYDAQTPAISEERTFFAGFSRGLPDGSSMDADGYLWNCRYGGGCIVRVAPNGTIDRVIDIPTHNVTTCTFGGRDLRTVYVTTAAAGAKPGDRFAGGVFAIRTNVVGQPENRFILAT